MSLSLVVDNLRHSFFLPVRTVSLYTSFKQRCKFGVTGGGGGGGPRVEVGQQWLMDRTRNNVV